MAMFASTTIPYSATNNAATLKALEQRQKDMAAQIASSNAITPENTQTPIQGFGHIANQLGDQMRMSRLEAQAKAGRDELAATIAQGPQGANGEWSPQQMATMSRHDPETMARVMQQAHDARLAQAVNALTARGQDVTVRGQDVGAQTAQRGQDVQVRGQDVGAQTAARGQDVQVRGQDIQSQDTQRGQDVQVRGQDVGAQTAARGQDVQVRGQDVQSQDTQRGQDVQVRGQDVGAQTAARGQDIQVRGQDVGAQTAARGQDVQVRGQDIQARGQDIEAETKRNEIKPAVIKNLTEAKSSYVEHSRLADNLDRAENYLKQGINTGFWANPKTAAAQAFGIGDKEQAQRTVDFKNLVEEIAITRMSQTLKGSSTDKEMNKFTTIFNDPNRSPQEREAAFRGLINAARADRNIYADAVKQYGGDTAQIDRDMRGGEGSSRSSPAVKDPLEGRTISNDKGEVMVRRNGKWEPK